MTPHPSNFRSLTAYRAAQAAHPAKQPKQARRFRPLVWLAGAVTFILAYLAGGRSEAKEYREEHGL